jgi:putative component of toxin-antitoxin plasmid stabilization module
VKPEERPKLERRRHGNHFEMRTTEGEGFRIYLDRGVKKGARRVWVLERRLA